MVDHKIIVELRNIRKEFPGVVALDRVNMSIKKGRIHALIGENGAGKSTLMKILSGTYTNYEGQIFYEEKEIHLKSEKDALELGIAIVAQELNPIPDLSIAENLFLGREPVKVKGLIDKKERLRKTKDCLHFMGLDYHPDTLMRNLSVAQKQMVEILKAISRNSKVIIMDEPTSALTNMETKILFERVRSLREKGIAFVFISHRLEEIFELCDDITVLRDGTYIGSDLVEHVTQDKLISMMVGRELKDIYPPIFPHKQKEVLRVEKLCLKGNFRDVSFQIREGEIQGFAGMMGAGRSEIAKAIFGLDRYDSGEIYVEGVKQKIRSTKDAINRGIAMVTEDRAAYGFVGVRSIKENIILPNEDIYSKHGIWNNTVIRRCVDDIMAKLSVKAPDMETLAGTLSGGNQQKVVLSKWLVRNVKVLILDEPTRGIDVGAKQEIYKLIAELARQGMAILLISSDMPEVLAMSHVIKVVANGSIVGELERALATQDKIMKMIVDTEAKVTG